MTDAYQNAITTALLPYNIGSSVSGLEVSNNSVNVINSITVPFNTPVNQQLDSDGIINFNNRYTTLDAFSSNEDGSDLGYIRVLRFTNGLFGSQVYPNVAGNKNVSNLNIYQDFIVTNLSSGFVEKAQIIKTNKTLQVYSFDSQPEVLNIQGVLKATLQCYWDMAMVILWDNILRLSQLTLHNLIVEFGYQGNIYWGYPLNFQWQKSSNLQMLASYSMQFLVVKRTIIARNSDQVSLANSINNQIQNISNIN
jgi:hypothetical protein